MFTSSIFQQRGVSLPTLLGAILALSAGTVLAAPGGQAGTTLSASKIADGFWEQIWEYDWSVQKSVDPDAYEFLALGEKVTATYTIDATKSGPTRQSDAYGAEGEICVTNGGDRATEGLQIADDILFKTGSGKFKVLQTGSVDVGSKPVLGPGESYCYPYKIIFTPVNGAKYKNSARVTITNHSGHLGANFGPSPDDGFALPTTPEMIYWDETANLTDVFGDYGLTTAFEFDFSGVPVGSMVFDESGSLEFPVKITYTGVCEEVFTLTNRAALTEADTNEVSESTASLVLQGPSCRSGDEDPDPVGCTYTQGFWKTHGPEGCHKGNNGNEWPVDELQLGGYTYNQSELCAILNEEPSVNNGLISMAHQLIAAKFNSIEGASPNPLPTISQADSLIGDLVIPPLGNGSLPSNQTSPLTSLLDMFNNGDADYDSDGDPEGPPHCD